MIFKNHTTDLAPVLALFFNGVLALLRQINKCKEIFWVFFRLDFSPGMHPVLFTRCSMEPPSYETGTDPIAA